MTTRRQPWLDDPAPAPLDTRWVVLVGCLVWAVALAVTTLVPALHTGPRAWWPSACLAGLTLGGVGLALLQVVRRHRS